MKVRHGSLHAIVAILTMALLSPAAAAAEAEQAKALVRETANQVLSRLEDGRSDLRNDPERIYELIEDVVLPHFDFTRMTQWALGRYWRRADDAQKEALVDQFRTLLVRTYGTALLDYRGQELRYLPMHAPENPERVTVKTQVDQGSGPPIDIDYRMHFEDGQWKVFDIAVDGVSLVTNYRSSFASTVRQAGIGGLIEQLKERNEQGS